MRYLYYKMLPFIFAIVSAYIVIHNGAQNPEDIFQNQCIPEINTTLFNIELKPENIIVLKIFSTCPTTKIESGSFREMTNLETLVLELYLEEIPSHMFKELAHVKNVDLSNNQIKSLKNYSFHGLENTITLNLSRNRIEDIDEYAFEPFKTLEELNLNYNRISYISDRIFRLGYYMPRVMKHVNLAYNQIGFIEKATFRNWKKLNTLILAGNPLNSTQFINEDLSVFKLDLSYTPFIGKDFKDINRQISQNQVNEIVVSKRMKKIAKRILYLKVNVTTYNESDPLIINELGEAMNMESSYPITDSSINQNVTIHNLAFCVFLVIILFVLIFYCCVDKIYI